jgi:hypothetical protein
MNINEYINSQGRTVHVSLYDHSDKYMLPEYGGNLYILAYISQQYENSNLLDIGTYI